MPKEKRREFIVKEASSIKDYSRITEEDSNTISFEEFEKIRGRVDEVEMVNKINSVRIFTQILIKFIEKN